eukprot:Rmarinus@m.112
MTLQYEKHCSSRTVQFVVDTVVECLGATDDPNRTAAIIQNQLGSEYLRDSLFGKRLNLQKPVCLDESNKIYYVPFENSLTSLLESDNIGPFVHNHCKEMGEKYGNVQQQPDVMYCWMDASVFRKTKEWRENPGSIFIQLYYDDVNPCNGLCPSNAVRNMAVFYYKLFNIPKFLASKVSTIQLLAVCPEPYVVEGGMESILSLMKEELEKLGKTGLRYKQGGSTYCRKVFAYCFVGDSKALHRVCGQRTCWTTGQVCRFCTATIEQIRNNDGSIVFGATRQRRRQMEAVSQLRGHAEDGVATLKDLPDELAKQVSAANLRVRHPYIFNLSYMPESLHYFPRDLFHDLWEGVASQELFRFSTWLTSGRHPVMPLQKFQDIIDGFQAGIAFCGTRFRKIITAGRLASATVSKGLEHSTSGRHRRIKNRSLGCRGDSVKLLLRIVNFVVQVRPEFESLRCHAAVESLQALARLAHLMWLPVMTAATVKNIWETLRRHRRCFVEAYSSSFLTSKHHGLDEAARSIELYGPIIYFETSRHEAKNALAKSTVQRGNRRNMPYSFAHGVLGAQCAALENGGTTPNVKYSECSERSYSKKHDTARKTLTDILIQASTPGAHESLSHRGYNNEEISCALASFPPETRAVDKASVLSRFIRSAKSVSLGGVRFQRGCLVRTSSLTECPMYVVIDKIFVVDRVGTGSVPVANVFFSGPAVKPRIEDFCDSVCSPYYRLYHGMKNVLTNSVMIPATRCRYHRTVHAWGPYGTIDIRAFKGPIFQGYREKKLYLTDLDFDSSLLSRGNNDFSVDLTGVKTNETAYGKNTNRQHGEWEDDSGSETDEDSLYTEPRAEALASDVSSDGLDALADDDAAGYFDM